MTNLQTRIFACCDNCKHVVEGDSRYGSPLKCELSKEKVLAIWICDDYTMDSYYDQNDITHEVIATNPLYFK